MTRKSGTQTSNFGVSRRENHDSSKFYSRFDTPIISTSEDLGTCSYKDEFICGDSRKMVEIEDNSVALVVTSPPYFSSKAYEEDISLNHVPSSYLDYLEMLHDVFKECWRVLEPGGRIAINVANLGRKPFRSLSKDVWEILEDLGYLPRGEIVWIKAAGASGNCAWGSWMSASNPSLRDVTERVLIASKGRFDRALHWKKRKELGLAFESTISRDDFLAWTLDRWEIRPESATKVRHPAPFPIELPRRLIELYTYRNDVVLDPFMGSGTTAIAAKSCDRYFVGYDTEPDYVAISKTRLAENEVVTQIFPNDILR